MGNTAANAAGLMPIETGLEIDCAATVAAMASEMVLAFVATLVNWVTCEATCAGEVPVVGVPKIALKIESPRLCSAEPISEAPVVIMLVTFANGIGVSAV